jgi:hypothetical protein
MFIAGQKPLVQYPYKGTNMSNNSSINYFDVYLAILRGSLRKLIRKCNDKISQLEKETKLPDEKSISDLKDYRVKLTNAQKQLSFLKNNPELFLVPNPYKNGYSTTNRQAIMTLQEFYQKNNCSSDKFKQYLSYNNKAKHICDNVGSALWGVGFTVFVTFACATFVVAPSVLWMAALGLAIGGAIIAASLGAACVADNYHFKVIRANNFFKGAGEVNDTLSKLSKNSELMTEKKSSSNQATL